jgi:hypothetical protein
MAIFFGTWLVAVFTLAASLGALYYLDKDADR